MGKKSVDYKNTLFDLSEEQTGVPITKRRVVVLLACASVFAVFSIFGMTLGLESIKASMALGLVLATMVFLGKCENFSVN